jgi:hypothetical protein
MEQVAGLAGDAAIQAWLHYRDHTGQLRKRYAVHKDRPNDAIPRTEDMQDYPDATDNDALRYIVRGIEGATKPRRVTPALKKTLQSLSVTDPTPCDKYGCPRKAECAEKRLACWAFQNWATEHPRERPLSPWVRYVGKEKRLSRYPVATRMRFDMMCDPTDE